MKKLKTSALAGILAISTSFAAPSYADAIGCTSDGSTAAEIAALEQVIAALQQWISNRTPADPNYATQTSHLSTVQGMLAITIAGNTSTSKPPFSMYACKLDVSPA